MAETPKVTEIKDMTIRDLRGILIEEIDKLQKGKSSPAIINAITNATGKVFSSVKLEMEYAKLIGKPLRVKMIEDVK